MSTPQQLNLSLHFWRYFHRLYIHNIPFTTDDLAQAASLCVDWDTHLTTAINCQLNDDSFVPTDPILRNLAQAFTEALRSYDITATLQIYPAIILRHERLNNNLSTDLRRTTPRWLTWNR